MNAGKPVLNVNDFCSAICRAGNQRRAALRRYRVRSSMNRSTATPAGTSFRAPFQVRFDMTLGKEFVMNERFRLRFNFDAFNVFNHPDFDAPNNDVTFFPDYSGPPSFPPVGSLGIIQHTIGSSRFLQLSMHLRVLEA